MESFKRVIDIHSMLFTPQDSRLCLKALIAALRLDAAMNSTPSLSMFA